MEAYGDNADEVGSEDEDSWAVYMQAVNTMYK